MRPRISKAKNAIKGIEDLPYVCNAVEAGLLLRQTPETVRKMAREGQLVGAKQGQNWFFLRDDLVKHLNQLFGAGRGGDCA